MIELVLLVSSVLVDESYPIVRRYHIHLDFAARWVVLRLTAEGMLNGVAADGLLDNHAAFDNKC